MGLDLKFDFTVISDTSLDLPPSMLFEFKFIKMLKLLENCWVFQNRDLDRRIVHENTFLMNTLMPLVARVRKLIESKLVPYLGQPPVIRRKIAVQLEFPWLSKR